MTRLIAISFTLAALFLTGCEKAETTIPKPVELTSEAVDHFCGMNVLEHPGPKGQIILKSGGEPVWFSSSRDAVAFTKLPEEPKDIAAFYVSDMSHADSWEAPGPLNWIDAKTAFYVVGSQVHGGMGAPETVPFSLRADADAFAQKNGGKVLTFEEIADHDVLQSTSEPSQNAKVGSNG
ncbi:nitrous oxide reductase accessory protein NosL [Rhizobium sp. R693]|uniref:nitrous oxide reductase accessory protein NosL n=1 Tax=Rhizobium sp. R693 TaxID=1764276 RepID=UPI000B634DCC|nr:nitrous oxide reductase accessory protein NosL [Rhizobium sp. R693]OWV83259.1 copper resistance protein CopZ [Rhizobium sp. R693]